MVSATATELLAVTRKGRVADWTDRIAVVAEEVGLDLAGINWNQSPSLVATEVSRIAYGADWDENLKAIIARMKKAQQQDEATPS